MKKKATRKTTKKPARRTAPSASKRRREWADISPPHKCFWCRDGQILGNIRELPSALRKMNKETFVHHVNRDRNDFAKWISEVIGEPRLAKTVRNLKTRAAIVKALQAKL